MERRRQPLGRRTANRGNAVAEQQRHVRRLASIAPGPPTAFRRRSQPVQAHRSRAYVVRLYVDRRTATAYSAEPEVDADRWQSLCPRGQQSLQQADLAPMVALGPRTGGVPVDHNAPRVKLQEGLGPRSTGFSAFPAPFGLQLRSRRLSLGVRGKPLNRKEDLPVVAAFDEHGLFFHVRDGDDQFLVEHGVLQFRLGDEVVSPPCELEVGRGGLPDLGLGCRLDDLDASENSPIGRWQPNGRWYTVPSGPSLNSLTYCTRTVRLPLAGMGNTRVRK